jgi:beta-lactamase superfamily II metal-dependent hydrolase
VRQRILIITVACVLVILLLAVREVLMAAPRQETTVHFFDVGQGDASLVIGPSGEQIVIDGGPNLSLLEHLERTMPFWDRTIDLLVLSHPHQDHLFAFPELLKRYAVHNVLMTGMDFSLPRYREMLTLLKEKNVNVLLADPAKDIIFRDGLMLDVVWPRPGLLGQKGDANNTSVALRVLYGKDSVLFTGDMEEPEERDILSAGIDVSADILKVAHHGSRTSSSTGFLLAVKATQAVVSVAAENSYKLPNDDVLQRLRNFGMAMHLTSLSGSLTVTLDGR